MTWSEVIELEMQHDELERLRRFQSSGSSSPALDREIEDRTRRERELVERLMSASSK